MAPRARAESDTLEYDAQVHSFLSGSTKDVDSESLEFPCAASNQDSVTNPTRDRAKSDDSEDGEYKRLVSQGKSLKTLDIFEPDASLDAITLDNLQSRATDYFQSSAFGRAAMHQHGVDVSNTTINCPENPATQCVFPPPRCAHDQMTLMKRILLACRNPPVTFDDSEPGLMQQRGADDIGNTTINYSENPATAHGQTTLMMRSIAEYSQSCANDVPDFEGAVTIDLTALPVDFDFEDAEYKRNLLASRNLPATFDDFEPGLMQQRGADDIGNTTVNCSENPATAHGQTTLMMRSIPNDYTRDQLLQVINREGFEQLYDFFYLPIDAHSGLNLAYAFINLVDADSAKRFSKTFTGYHKWIFPSRKQCSISLSKVQGYANNVKSFKTKPLMRQSVREDRKPVVFQGGVQVPWPKS